MNLEQVKTTPDPYAPFLLSQGIRVGHLVFISGQAGVDDDGSIKEGFDAQADQAFRNLDRALKAAGSSLRQVAKVTIFLTSMDYFPKIVELRRKWFSPPYPADTIVEVSSLYSSEAMIEIEAIAVVPREGA
jgi:reactive intermediate/imine deaminase